MRSYAVVCGSAVASVSSRISWRRALRAAAGRCMLFSAKTICSGIWTGKAAAGRRNAGRGASARGGGDIRRGGVPKKLGWGHKAGRLQRLRTSCTRMRSMSGLGRGSVSRYSHMALALQDSF